MFTVNVRDKVLLNEWMYSQGTAVMVTQTH